MPIVAALIAGGLGIAIGRRLFGPRPARASSAPPSGDAPPSPVGGRLREAEEAYQRFVARRIDPLFGGARAKNLEAQRKPDDAVPERDRTVNRNLGLSGALTATAIATASLHPLVRTAITVPPAAYLIWRRYRHTADAAAEGQRSLKVAVLSAANLGVVWLTGYYVVGGTLLALVYLGEKVSNLTEGRAHARMADVFRPPEGEVRRASGDGFELAAVHTLAEGDVIVVSGGQTIPADGRIIAGQGLVDRSWLTGESRPVEVGVDDELLATTTLLDGEIRLLVLRAGEATAAADIGRALDAMSSYQSTIITRATRMADASVVPTAGAAVLAGLTVGIPGMAAIGSTVIGLNLDFSGPIAVLTHANEAATRGILVKDGRSLELIDDVDVVLFDKTGVLTESRLVVADVRVTATLDADTVLGLAAAVESDQPHPIAAAIRRAASARGQVCSAPDGLETRLGHGVSGAVDGRRVAVGNARWMTALGVAVPAAEATSDGRTRVFVAVDGALAGEILLDAPIRAEAPRVVEALRARGLEVAIVSGDGVDATRRVAEALGVDWFEAEALPEDKAAIVHRLQGEGGRKVCFVGDGINDAVALKAASVSISPGGASDVATTVAQMVLLDASLEALPDIFTISRDLHTTLRDLWVLSIVPGAVIWAGVFFAHLGVLGAAVLFEGSLWAGVGRAVLPALKRERTAEKVEQAHDAEMGEPPQTV